jgi:hypothetical protein
MVEECRRTAAASLSAGAGKVGVVGATTCFRNCRRHPGDHHRICSGIKSMHPDVHFPSTNMLVGRAQKNRNAELLKTLEVALLRFTT